MNKIIGKRKHKYGAKKCEVDGIVFDSMHEMKRYHELKLLQRAGKIQNLKLQPEFELQEEFTYKGKKIRPIKYIADFMYNEGDKIVVEDTKGYKTDVYNLKIKIFKKRYPEFEFRET